jgi:hypothetical protein
MRDFVGGNRFEHPARHAQERRVQPHRAGSGAVTSPARLGEGKRCVLDDRRVGKARGNLAYQRQRIFFVVDLSLMNALNQAAREFDDRPIKRRIVDRVRCADVQRCIRRRALMFLTALRSTSTVSVVPATVIWRRSVMVISSCSLHRAWTFGSDANG